MGISSHDRDYSKTDLDDGQRERGREWSVKA